MRLLPDPLRERIVSGSADCITGFGPETGELVADEEALGEDCFERGIPEAIELGGEPRSLHRSTRTTDRYQRVPQALGSWLVPHDVDYEICEAGCTERRAPPLLD